VRQRLEDGPLSDYCIYGYGRFAVELKKTGKLIGFCGIKYLPENTGSIRIAEKLGMTRGPRLQIIDVEAYQYEKMF
jgi:RimJ/RimL family protein N-acetyltransferase